MSITSFLETHCSWTRRCTAIMPQSISSAVSMHPLSCACVVVGPRRSRRQPCTSRTQTTTIRTAPHEEHYPELPRTSHRVHTDFEDWNSKGSNTFVTISFGTSVRLTSTPTTDFDSFGTSARSTSTLPTPRTRPCSTGTRSPTPWPTREADHERRVLHLARLQESPHGSTCTHAPP